MKIEQLILENFKCFKIEQTFDFSRLTILTGANSSGKSSVVNAILMILQSEGFPKSLSTNGDFVNLGDFEDIANGHDSSKIISLGLKVSSTERTDNFSSTWQIDKTNYLPDLKEQKTNMVANNPKARGMGRPISIFKFGQDRVNFIGAFRQPPQRTNLEKNHCTKNRYCCIYFE